MAEEVVMSKAMALVEKKVDMTLDELIKISRSNAKMSIMRRVSNRQGKFVDKVTQDRSSRVQKFMDSRSSLRQGALAQKRSNFNGNQFPLAYADARKSSSWGKPFKRQFTVNEQRGRVIAFQRKVAKRPMQQVKGVVDQKAQKTLDSRFANMKEQRMRLFPLQNNIGSRMNFVMGQNNIGSRMNFVMGQNNIGSRMNFVMGQNNIGSRINFMYRHNNNGGTRRRNGSGPNIVPWARNHF